MSEIILETSGLTKQFRGFVAVKDVNLKIRRGTVHALIGPNGAGRARFSGKPKSSLSQFNAPQSLLAMQTRLSRIKNCCASKPLSDPCAPDVL